MKKVLTPWYKTRRFWLIIISIQIVTCFLIFLPSLISENVNLSILSVIKAITGYGSYYFIIFLAIGHNKIVSTILYLMATSWISYKTFFQDKVNYKIVYPLIYLVFAIISTVLTVISASLF